MPPPDCRAASSAHEKLQLPFTRWIGKGVGVGIGARTWVWVQAAGEGVSAGSGYDGAGARALGLGLGVYGLISLRLTGSTSSLMPWKAQIGMSLSTSARLFGLLGRWLQVRPAPGLHRAGPTWCRGMGARYPVETARRCACTGHPGTAWAQGAWVRVCTGPGSRRTLGRSQQRGRRAAGRRRGPTCRCRLGRRP